MPFIGTILAWTLTALHVAIYDQNIRIPAFALHTNIPDSANIRAPGQNSHWTDVIGDELKGEYEPQ